MDNLHKILKEISLIILIVTSELAFAGPPFVTDDPEPVAENTWEVNYGISKTWLNGSTSASLPAIDINYGYSENIQLHAQPRYSYQTEGRGKYSSFDNTEIGVKYRFIHQEQNDVEFMLGIYPMLQLPTGDKKIGEASGETQAFLPIWAQLNTEKWTLYGGTGYRVNNYTFSKNSWFLGVTALYEIDPNLKIGGELYRETASTQGGKYSSGFNIGGIYNISKAYGFLFSTGRALNKISETNDLSVFLALQVIY